MAFFDTTWYVNFGNGTNTGHYAVPVRPQNTAVVAGQLCRKFTPPAVGGELVYVCRANGTTANTTDATWGSANRGGTITPDGTTSWQECTGAAAVNGDWVNTPTWAAVKATGLTVSAGVIIKRNSGTSYHISNGGSIGASEPAFSDVAGSTVSDGGSAWTCIGPVGNFTGGQAPHARLANVFAANWFASGNTVYIGDNHAETQATSITLSASSALMARILCHNHVGPYPPTASDLKTGATIATSANISINFAMQGSFYFYGLTILAGTAGVASSNMIAFSQASVGQVQNWLYFSNCSFQIVGVGTAAYIQVGNNTSSSWLTIIFDNSTVKFAKTDQYIMPLNAQLTWQNGPLLASGSLVPTALFQDTATAVALSTIIFEGVDLSPLTGSLYTIGMPGIGGVLIKDCKLNAAATITQPINTGQIVQNSRSSSLAAPYVSSRHTYEAIETTETSIVRSGGFTDPTGQVQSRKIVTSANAQWLRPYKAEPYAVWNSVVGSSVTATVYGLAGIGALPNNDDIWLELQYLGSSASPLGSVATTGKANVWSSNIAVPSDGSSWPVVRTTFDGLLTSVTVSNGGLTVTHGNTTNNVGVASSAAFWLGKYYFEITAAQSSASSQNIGVLLFGGTTANLVSGTNCTTVSMSGSCSIISNNVSTGKNLGTFANGDVFGFAIDLTNRLAWIRKNNGNWNGLAIGSENPATGLGGVVIAPGQLSPCVGFNGIGSTDNVTANFGQTAFSMTPPSGFLSWDTGWIPFKLTTSFTLNLPGYILGRVRAAKQNTVFYIDPKLELS